MAETCLFCRIAAGELPAEVVLRTDEALAFRDVNPVAPVHVLVIPLKHVPSLSLLEDEGLAGKLMSLAGEVARREGLEETGYRLVINTGADAGQSVEHLHAHVLGGRKLSWPPG